MTKKVGVLFIENYVAGGGDQVARALIQHLPFKRLTVMVNARNDTRILLAGSLPSHVQIERYGLLTVAELSYWANTISHPLFRLLARCTSFVLRYPLFVFSILYFRVRLARIGANVFLANNGGYPGGFYCRSATLAASLFSSLNVFHVVHGMAQPARGLSRPIEWCVDWIIDHCSRIITVSYATKARLTAVRNIRQPIAVIYNGLPDFAPFPHIESNTLRILHVGYFDHNKNQRSLIEAVAALHRSKAFNIEVRFIGADAGEGCLAACQNLAAKLGVHDQVKFMGFVETIDNFYAEADVFVLCSHSEGLPMSILEAMRAGRPVVATAVGGISEQIEDSICGLLIPANDSAALAEKLVQLKQDPALRTRLGRAARMRYEGLFTTSKMTLEYVKILELHQ